ncbi:MAG TPA: aminotransferase class I/II-fold pyridoxal phosphate-dependent enzyme, partial [Aquirhabdus sp.]
IRLLFLGRARILTCFDLAKGLREDGIIVRHFAKPRISEFLRITIGTAEQNQALVKRLKVMLG